MIMRHGPEWQQDGSVTFRLWAPSANSVDLLLDDQQPQAMEKKSDGWYGVTSKRARAGSRYRFQINGKLQVPDPASRFQPDDVNGPSELLPADHFSWPETNWQGRPWAEAVIYELHVGTFSPEGNYAGVEKKLDYLATLGITAIELMPLADFAGKRGWGYDGVLPYAPDSAYGRPEELKQLIAAAHARGIMVFLDVVYNHFGPSGNYLPVYAKTFFNEHDHTPWGAAINFEESQQVRDFFIDNAVYWLDEFRFDGLRFDAVHAIVDASRETFLKQLSQSVRERVSPDRHIHLILENDRNDARFLTRNAALKPEYFTAQWNDDIHHVLHVLTSGETIGYYQDYSAKTLEQLGRCLAEGFAYQGDPSANRKGETRGEPSTHLPPQAFVSFLQNHDQIGNRAMGERLSALTDEEKLTLAQAILFLSPQPPMLFMGEEWATQTPFYYFCDFEGELADAVREGRRKEFAGFPEFSDPAAREKIPDPNAPQTFRDSTLNWEEKDQEPYHKRLAFTQKLLALRAEHIVPLLASPWVKNTYQLIERRGLDVRWQFAGNAELQLLANFSDKPLPVSHNGGIPVWGNFNDALPAWKCSWSVRHGQ